MPSETHENMLEVVRQSVRMIQLADDDEELPVPMLDGDMAANTLLGAGRRREGLIPDLLIALPDGCEPVLVEVGDMKRNKWRGSPYRILRVTYDNQTYLLNPCHTEWEKILLATIDCLLFHAIKKEKQ